MKRILLLVILILSVLIISWVPIQAQDNLLSNPGFEATFSDQGGDPPRQVAQDWVAWHVPQSAGMADFENLQPKYEPVAPNTSRIRSGGNAQQYSSFFATHDGGIYQQVSGITPNTELRFSIYAYIWSSTFTDPELSEEDGNVFLQVGIDPDGGTNPASADVKWSTPSEFYDAYRQYSVIETAGSDTVTVWVRTVVGEPVWNSFIYLDDAVLEVTPDSGPATAVPTDVPSATPVPSDTLEPTDEPSATPEPTDEPVPTDTLEPSPTRDIVPTATEEPTGIPTNTTVPSATPIPSNTPIPTNTTIPSATPIPSNTPIPSATPIPSNTPIPTNTTIPSATPIPTNTPVPTPITDEFPGTTIHRVQRGDTVSRISSLYGSNIQAIITVNGLNSNALIFVGQELVIPIRIANPATETPTATPINIPPEGTPNPEASGVYVVQPNDNLTAIAIRFNTTVRALVQLNGITNPNRIFVGQRLSVPSSANGLTPTPVPTQPPGNNNPQTHMVIPGDSLYKIALMYNVTIQQLAEANRIANPNLIFYGQVLTIPQG